MIRSGPHHCFSTAFRVIRSGGNSTILSANDRKFAHATTVDTVTTDINQIGPCLLRLQMNHYEGTKVEVGEGN